MRPKFGPLYGEFLQVFRRLNFSTFLTTIGLTQRGGLSECCIQESSDHFAIFVRILQSTSQPNKFLDRSLKKSRLRMVDIIFWFSSGKKGRWQINADGQKLWSY
jgi:hypothetical protein